MVSVLLAGQSMVSGVSVKLNICIYMAYFGYKAEGQSTYMQLYAAIHDKLIFALLYFQHTSRKMALQYRAAPGTATPAQDEGSSAC